MTDHRLALALAALAQPTRFRIMRELLACGRVGGLHAGEVAERVGRGHSGTAVHLKELERAGLALSADNGHAIFFQPDAAGLGGFVDDLRASLGDGAAIGRGRAAADGSDAVAPDVGSPDSVAPGSVAPAGAAPACAATGIRG